MKNIAYMRKVFHSSKFDKNSAGHLVTSGNPKDESSKRGFVIYDQYNDAIESVYNIIDDQCTTRWFSPHIDTYFEIKFEEAVSAKGYRIQSDFYDASMNVAEWQLLASNDGINYTELDRRRSWLCDEKGPHHLAYYVLNRNTETKDIITYIDNKEKFKFYRLKVLKNFGNKNGVVVGDFELMGQDGKSLLKDTDGHFEQYWKSKGNENEYLLLDLGKESRISQMIFDWGSEYALEYEILYSIDGVTYECAYKTEQGKGGIETLNIGIDNACFLKLLLHKSSGEHFLLKEWKVIGENELSYDLGDAPEYSQGRQYLKNGNWCLERASEVNASGEELSQACFNSSEWLPAVVPGTVLTSFVKAGAVCDYHTDRNAEQYSDAFFTCDWWYRNNFVIEKQKNCSRVMLNFDAIHWKADVFFNGAFLGNINGAFIRGKFDITEYVRYGEENYLAICIHRNDYPGHVRHKQLNGPWFLNGGVNGLDEPCLAAAIGWDWIDSIAGRNIGIYKDVYLSFSGDVQIIDPWVETVTDLGQGFHHQAELTLHTELHNKSDRKKKILLSGKIQPTGICFEKYFELLPNQECEVAIENITIDNPKLWYPNGYGEASLYGVELLATEEEIPCDEKKFDFGIRTFTYKYIDGNLRIYCNGKRIVCVGGNWGMDDANVCCTPEDYDIKVRLHRDMNLNMIRNWVGQVNDEEFYNACDRYGIMVWDDFWLANPGDGPNPKEPEMFMQNAEDKVKKIRRHPSLTLYCGRNEGNPVEPLRSLLPKLLERLDKTRLYIHHSADDGVSGYGPYSTLSREFYFRNTPKTLHSERGLTNIPVADSVKRFLSPEKRWPINEAWAAHDFFYNGAQANLDFLKELENYGKFENLEEFCTKAQMLDYIVFKSVFEAERAADGNGMLLWMSNPAHPSFNFQTYDYYNAINGGFIGVKISNQITLAYYNPIDRKIWADNRSDEEIFGKVKVQVFGLKGEILLETEKETKLNMDKKCIVKLPVYKETVLLRTVITDNFGKEISYNFDWIFPSEESGEGISNISKTTVSVEKCGKNELFIKNTGMGPAIQIHLTIRKACDNTPILPVFWSDNFISLNVGEECYVKYELQTEEQGELIVSAQGYNIDYTECKSD